MKKSLILLMCLLMGQLVLAGVITQEEAQEKAAAFLSERHAGGPRHALRIAAKGAQLSAVTTQSSYYVFNVGEQKGFVVVSGDDRTPAILGYANQGSFDSDNIPENMRAWLQGYADQLNYLNSHPEAAIAKVALHEHASIAPLMSSTWNQGAPYNAYCPDDEGTRSWTGCVATAMAQVLYYYKHPAKTTALIPAYTTSTKGFSIGSIGVTTIDWQNMKDHYSGYESAAQNKAIATLMQLCGSAVRMDYSSKGSNAYSADVPTALKTYFDYDATTRVINRGDYRAAEWDDVIYQELAEQRPVYYSGQATGGGHAFVVDGYDKDGLYHLNWGWGGSCDNYFLLSILDPDSNDGIGASTSTDGYSFSQEAVIGTRPNTGEPFDDMRMSLGSISCTQNTVWQQNGTFSVWADVNDIWPRSANSHVYDIGLGIFDSDGQLKYAEKDWDVQLDPGWGYPNATLWANIPTLPDGRYQITAVTQESGTNTWTRNIGGNLQFLTATINGNTMTIQSPVIDLSGKMIVYGNRQYYTTHTATATFQNNGTLFTQELFLLVDGEKVGGRYFEVDAGETETVDMTFTPTTVGKKHLQIGYYTYYYDEGEGGWQEEFHMLASTNVTIGTEPENVYSIAGSAEALFGSVWDAANAETEMSRESDYLFTWKKEYVDLYAGNVEFKVVVNHSWSECYPASNYVLNIPQDGTYSITINFNEESKAVWATTVRVNALADAQTLAADDDGVAVGKLRKAIEVAIESGDDSGLADAIEQFKADNADLEKDETAKVATDGWKKFNGNDAAGVCAEQFAPKIITYDGRYVNLAENYETTTATTGQIIYQDINGLTNGTYKVGFYGNAFYTSGRGFSSPMEEGANDVAYVFANDQQAFITAHIATATTENDFREFNVEVTDGQIRLGMGKAKAGTNWHTMQIYQLTWFVTAKALYAANQADLMSTIAAASTLVADPSKPNGKNELNAAITAAEEGVGSNWYNNDEIEQMIADLKAAIAAFKKANYYIDFAAGEYYIIDTESGNAMAAGHDWGTHGIVNETGLDLILTPDSETRTVTIDSRVSNGGSSHYLGSNLYMDSSAFGWALEDAGYGFYITNGEGQYINLDLYDNLVMSDTPREWLIVSKDGVMEARLAELASATAENPVDATFLITAQNFNRNDLRNSEAWNVEANNYNLSGGNNVNNNAESYHAAFTISQALRNAPAGIYKMTVQGFYRQDNGTEEDAPVFFIGNKTAQVLPMGSLTDHSGDGNNGMDDASVEFTNGNYTIEPIEVKYYGNGDLVIGVKGTATNQWVCFDNFQLTYCGPYEIESYTVAGAFKANKAEAAEEASFFGEAWTPTLEANDLEQGDDGLYTKTFENVALEPGTIFYKVVADHSWYAPNWGFGNYNADYVVNEAGNYNIVFTFNPATLLANGYNLTCELIDLTTIGISSIAAEDGKGEVYNLNGQRIDKIHKGFYIVRPDKNKKGKKLFVK